MPPKAKQQPDVVEVVHRPHQYTEEEQARIERMNDAGIYREEIVRYFEAEKAPQFLAKAIDHLEEKAGMTRFEARTVLWKEVLQHAYDPDNRSDKTERKVNAWSDAAYDEKTLGKAALTGVKPKELPKTAPAKALAPAPVPTMSQRRTRRGR